MAKTASVKKRESTAPIVRTSQGLRDALFDEMDALRQGKTTATAANAMAKLAGTVVETVEMELSVSKAMKDLPAQADAVQVPQIPLGSE